MTTLARFHALREDLSDGLRPDGWRDRWKAWRERRRSARALLVLARRDPRLIRDMGLDPEAIRAALEGSWDDMRPADAREHLPHASRI
jgi:hypothetical protein